MAATGGAVTSRTPHLRRRLRLLGGRLLLLGGRLLLGSLGLLTLRRRAALGSAGTGC